MFFSILCILCFCILLCLVSPFAYSCLFPIFVQIYRPLPPGRNPIALNKYYTSCHKKCMQDDRGQRYENTARMHTEREVCVEE